MSVGKSATVDPNETQIAQLKGTAEEELSSSNFCSNPLTWTRTKQWAGRQIAFQKKDKLGALIVEA